MFNILNRKLMKTWSGDAYHWVDLVPSDQISVTETKFVIITLSKILAEFVSIIKDF